MTEFLLDLKTVILSKRKNSIKPTLQKLTDEAATLIVIK